MFGPVQDWIRAHLGRQEGDGQKLWSRRRTKLYFDNEDLDVYLIWALARAGSRCAEVGECLAAAADVEPKQPDSWARAWSGVADRVAEVGKAAARSGHAVSARDALLRASTYYRVAAAFLPPGDQLGEIYRRSVACFRQAVAGDRPAVEVIEIPYGGASVPGYFFPADDSGRPRPTVLVFPGGEMVAEDAYPLVAVAAARRGYHTVGFDPPGWSAYRLRNPDAPRISAAQLGSVATAVVDFVTARGDVDPAGIVGLGFSGGGFSVLNAATSEHRFAAVVASGPILSMHKLVTAEMPGALQRMPDALSGALTKAAGLSNPYLQPTMQRFYWQFGVGGFSEFMEIMAEATTEGRTGEIRCPVLGLIGEGESPEQHRQARQVMAELTVRGDLRVFTAAEGAEGHSQLNNPSRMQEAAFDWLDELLQG